MRYKGVTTRVDHHMNRLVALHHWSTREIVDDFGDVIYRVPTARDSSDAVWHFLSQTYR